MASRRRRTATGLAGLALLGQLALFATADVTAATAAKTANAPSWLKRINQIRAGSGLGTVTADSSWTKGIKAHLIYLAKSPAKYNTGKYANAHTENPKSPYYTKAGALEASHSDLAFETSSDLVAINDWLEAPFHAIGILRPGLTKVAFARNPKTGGAGLDILSGEHFVAHSSPILYPGAGSTINLASYGGEVPSPIETCTTKKPQAHYSNPGLPLIALLPRAPATHLSASLTKPSGKTIASTGNDLCVVDEKNFTSSDPVYGSTGRSILAGDHAVLIIPRTRLVSGRYSVDLSQSKRPDITWSFTSRPTIHPPHVSVTTHCSDAGKRTGSATLVIVNPPDGAGTVHYAVTLEGKTKHARAADGQTTQLGFASLGAGHHTAKVVGSDGSRTSKKVRISTCPRHRADLDSGRS